MQPNLKLKSSASLLPHSIQKLSVCIHSTMDKRQCDENYLKWQKPFEKTFCLMGLNKVRHPLYFNPQPEWRKNAQKKPINKGKREWYVKDPPLRTERSAIDAACLLCHPFL